MRKLSNNIVNISMLLKLPLAIRQEFLNNLTDDGYAQLKFDWKFWARPEQLEPEGLGKDGKFIWLYKAGRGAGKALWINTDIPTIDGFKKLKDIKVNDIIFNEKGERTRVTFVTPTMYNHKCYEVVFSDNSKIIADAEHQWETWDHSARKALKRAKNPIKKPKIITTEEIKNTLKHNNRENNHSIHLCGAVQYYKKDLIIEPYLLGIWLADGDSKGSMVTTGDPEVFNYIKDKGYKINQYKSYKYSYGIIKKGDSLLTKIRKLNLYKNKHIPDIYLKSSRNDRLELLQGLMDSDGYISERGSCEYTSVRKRLAENVLELVLSLGIKATLNEGDAKINGVFKSKKYRVIFTTNKKVFKLKRKLKRLKDRQGKSQQERNERRYIIAVNEVKSVPVKCIQVDSPSHLFLAGKNFIPTHNTRTFAEWIIQKVQFEGYRHVSLVGSAADEVRSIMIEGESGLLECSPPWFYPKYESSKKKITWPNGAIANIFYGSEPDKSRGAQSDIVWMDEIAKWQYPEDTFDNVLFGARLGTNPLVGVSTTPRPTKFIKELIKRDDCIVVSGSSYDNVANLADSFIKTIIKKYEGTRLGRQEIHAHLLDDNPNALFKREWIDRDRITAHVDCYKIVVGIDPQASSENVKAETGIVIAGEGPALPGMSHSDLPHYYIFDDLSLSETPEKWAKEAISGLHKYDGDSLIPEKNNGGDMVVSTIKNIDSSVSVHPVWASRGKYTRAEPISALSEQGRIHHIGTFPELEDELCEWTPGDKSPNRLDAYVWAISYLSGNNVDKTAPSVRKINRKANFRSKVSGGLPE
jgi:phage terminase large subunit-like protein